MAAIIYGDDKSLNDRAWSKLNITIPPGIDSLTSKSTNLIPYIIVNEFLSPHVSQKWGWSQLNS